MKTIKNPAKPAMVGLENVMSAGQKRKTNNTLFFFKNRSLNLKTPSTKTTIFS